MRAIIDLIYRTIKVDLPIGLSDAAECSLSVEVDTDLRLEVLGVTKQQMHLHSIVTEPIWNFIGFRFK